ncbi:hypothetical protein F444_21125 [Phytophthora nicotianae P1976]|uniref:Uncharacterized protein n=1 Tax=Phytophthora nicotianae P1976 TaxID=1317066 RepID=A0A080Z273_PHYNI|nr:hypothetical protein F444_21125 [Phytophthora nicotianae P1976]
MPLPLQSSTRNDHDLSSRRRGSAPTESTPPAVDASGVSEHRGRVLVDLTSSPVALSETQQSKIAETEKSKVAAVFAQADLHQQQVLARNAEIKALRQTFTDKDTAYSILQGVAAKHFEQQQKSARLLNFTNDQSLRHTLPTIENQRAVITRQKRVIARQGYISMHGPTWRLPLCENRVSAARDTIARLEKRINQVERSQKSRQDLESALATLQQERDTLAVQRDELLGQLEERFMEVTDLRAERVQAQERLSNIVSLLPSAPSHKRARSESESPTQSARVSKAARSTSGLSQAGASSHAPAFRSSIEVLSVVATGQTAKRSVSSPSSTGPPDHLPRSVRSTAKSDSGGVSSSLAASKAGAPSDDGESSSGESGSTRVFDSDAAGNDSSLSESNRAKNEFGMPSGPLSDLSRP